MEEITGQMGDYRTPKDSKITPFLHRKGNTLKGERLSVSAKAQALQNTPKAAQQEQQEDTQIQFQTLNKIITIFDISGLRPESVHIYRNY